MKYGFNIPNYKYVKGIQNFRMNLENVAGAMKGASLQGLIEVQAKMHEDMLTIPPTIPKDLGNLRSSYYCVTSNGIVYTGKSPHFNDARKDASRLAMDHSTTTAAAIMEATSRAQVYGPNILIGFSAYYAKRVHEMGIETRGPINWTTPGSGAKYFETHVTSNKDLILKTLQKHVRYSLYTSAGLLKIMKKYGIK